MNDPVCAWHIGDRVTSDFYRGEPARITALREDGGFDYILDKPHDLGPRFGEITSGSAYTRDGWRRVSWDASQIKQPDWSHVQAAFIEGAREARANPEADDDLFKRAADGYAKRVFEELDPESERRLRMGDFT